jgi:hypothetical protein
MLLNSLKAKFYSVYCVQFLKQPQRAGPFKFFFLFMPIAQHVFTAPHALAIASDCHHGCQQALITY